MNVSFQFGSDNDYGSSTPAQKIGVSNSATAFSANLSGLAPGTTIHYRAVVDERLRSASGRRRSDVHDGLTAAW